MLDIKWIRENKEELDKLLKKRGETNIDINEIITLDTEKRQFIMLIQQLRQAKNTKSKRLAGLKGDEFERVKKDVEDINEKLSDLNAKLSESNKLQHILDNIPNLLDKDVPYGTDESMNKFIREFKKPIKLPYAKEHDILGKNLNMIDFEQTVKISGSRFVSLKYDLAKLERALISFMIDVHTKEHDYDEISVPYIVASCAMYNVGQLPKFSEDSYQIVGGTHRLIPTGEVPLTNMVADKILKQEELPIKYVGYTACFRSEAGSAGKDTKGMIRNHQFGKVELVTITTPEESKNEHEFMLNSSESILKKLDIPYRVMLLCSGDIGFSAQKTYDIEVWLPGQKKYREIASISNCGDFQARRMKARYKEYQAKETKFLHTLNGTGLAVGRTIVAILENYQNEDGSITIPKILRPYMGMQDKIVKR